MTGTQGSGTKAARQIIISGPESLASLRRFLGPREPGLAKAALKLWRDQGAVISKTDAEDMAGGRIIPDRVLHAWHDLNAAFVTDTVVPAWTKGFELAGADIERRMARLQHKAVLTRLAIDAFIQQHGSGLITALDKEGQEAIASVLKYAYEQNMNPYQLSLLLRSPISQQGSIFVGLFPRWNTAVFNRYMSLTAAGFTPAQATAQAAKYKEFLTKIRALSIARTELAEAYGEGQLSALKATGEQIRKRWATADDERTCEICDGLDGEERDINEAFSNGKQRNPGHTQCRCSVEYEAVREEGYSLPEGGAGAQPAGLLGE